MAICFVCWLIGLILGFLDGLLVGWLFGGGGARL
jgi:hypothetical protein